MKKLSMFLVLTALLASSSIAAAGVRERNGDDIHTLVRGRMRVLAVTLEEAQRAEIHGCKTVREARNLKAYECDGLVVTSLGLPEDVRVFAVDAGVNTQIGAGTVHAGGNTGAGRKIAVLDTGYDYNHPELTSSYLGGYDFVNNDTDPMDDNGHGSHVGGIITADGINSAAKGTASDAAILVGKVLAANGSGYFSDVVAAIYWAVDGPDGIASTSDDFNVDAINLSLGTGRPYVYRGFCDGVLPSMTSAIQYARSRGVTVVVAAGNEGRRGVSIPGCISYSLTVGAVDQSDKLAYFSGQGSAVDISAPGVSIFSTIPGGSYASWSGTSMATPVVAAVVALIKYAHPGNTVGATENVLFSTAKDLGKLGKDALYGWGRVYAQEAVK